MSSVVPTIVTHPCALLRDGLRQILGSSRFQPIHLAAECDQTVVRLASAEVCLWLIGVEKCSESTFDLVRRACKTTPTLKTVILAQRQAAEDVWPAIEAGARGFLYQNISSERLVKSLELVALGQIIVPIDFLYAVGNRLSPTTQPAPPVDHPQEPAQDFKALANGKESANGTELANDENLSTALIGGMSRRDLRTNQEALMRRADELGVSPVISEDDNDDAVDTRTLRSTGRFVDPLLERLKQIHGK